MCVWGQGLWSHTHTSWTAHSGQDLNTRDLLLWSRAGGTPGHTCQSVPTTGTRGDGHSKPSLVRPRLLLQTLGRTPTCTLSAPAPPPALPGAHL